MPSELRFQARTDKGLVRANNEDSYLAREEGRLFAVCDGLGGHAAGEIASRIAIDTLNEKVHDGADGSSRILSEAVEEANRKILRDQQQNPQNLGMGTTLSALWLPVPDQSKAWVAHIGDSRIYQLREGELAQLTEDHSPVYRLFKEGTLSKDQIRMHPQKNLIERSLGLTTAVQCDIFAVETKPRDRYLLCTDGLSDSLSDAEIGEVLQSEEWAEVAPRLIRGALERGGFDNITVVIVEITG
jgi:serine/threonine protein phosphatase PrpC